MVPGGLCICFSKLDFQVVVVTCRFRNLGMNSQMNLAYFPQKLLKHRRAMVPVRCTTENENEYSSQPYYVVAVGRPLSLYSS